MTDRLKFLRDRHGAALLDAFRADSRNIGHSVWERVRESDDVGAADHVFEAFREADPTGNGACLQWLIRLALAGGLPAEDLPKARETLETFLRYKRRLLVGSRDLGRYGSLGDVWKAIEPFILKAAPASNREEERRERDAVRAESEILLEQDGWTVAIPKTERAAKWWGRGTRWCTAAENDCRFQIYQNLGPLVVFIRPDGSKYQFHASADQFMDDADRPAAVEVALSDLIDRDLPNHLAGLIAALVPDRGHSRDALLAAVSIYGLPLKSVPEEKRDRDICLSAVMKDGYDLEYVPCDMADDDVCMAAIRQRSAAAKYLPPDRRDAILSRPDITFDPMLFRYAPDSLKTPELCLEMVRRKGATLKWVPDLLKERDLCLEAVKRDGGALHHVPLELRDAEMCVAALNSCSSASVPVLSAVPQMLRTPELCRSAIDKHPENLSFVPLEIVDTAMCLAAVRRGDPTNPSLARVPLHLRTQEICDAALKNIPDYLAYIGFPCLPYAFRTRRRCLECVIANWSMIEHVPLEYIDEKFVFEIVERLGRVPLAGVGGSSSVGYSTQDGTRIQIERSINFLDFLPTDMVVAIRRHARDRNWLDPYRAAWCFRTSWLESDPSMPAPSARTPDQWRQALKATWVELAFLPDAMIDEVLDAGTCLQMIGNKWSVPVATMPDRGEVSLLDLLPQSRHGIVLDRVRETRKQWADSYTHRGFLPPPAGERTLTPCRSGEA